MSRQGTGAGKTPMQTPGKTPAKTPGKTPGKTPAKTPGKGSKWNSLKTANRLATQGRMMTRGSRGLGTAFTEASIVQREAYVAPVDYDTGGLMHIIRDYLDKTELEKNFSELLRILLNRPQLPYNPYPGFATRLRPHAEKFIMFADSEEHIDNVTTMPLMETQLLNLYTLKERDGVWGLKSIMRVVNHQSVRKYRWMVEDLTPSRDNLFTLEAYSNQVMVALVGAAVFHGTFYTQCHIVQLRIEYLVTGPEVAQGVAIFINSVMLDIDSIMDSSNHTLLGVSVPVDLEEDEWEQDFWEPAQIKESKAKLLQLMSNAVAASKYIVAECIFKTERSQKLYVRGQKQYSLNFITVVEDNLKEEGLLSFSEFPMGSLHEGVFLSQTQAEAYVNVFSPQTHYADTQNVYRASARPTRPTSRLPRDGSVRRRPSMVYDDDRTVVHRHVHARLELMKPTKIRIDGFRIGDDSGFGPFAWQITSPIKSNLQSRIVSFHPQAQLFDIAYHCLLLILMDRSSYDPGLIQELYRLTHSTAGRLHILNEENKSLRAVIRGFAEKDDMNLARTFLKRYRDNLDEFLAHSLQARSNELIMVGRGMVAEVNRLLAPSDRDFSSATHVDHIVTTLRNIQNYSMPLLLQLSEDAMHWCPLLKDLIMKFHEIFPAEVLRPQTRYKGEEYRDEEGGRLNDEFKHGIEDERIVNHEYYVIDVEACRQKETVPKIMASESVLLKYVIDTHLDEVWHGFLVGLLADIQLLPNPYPRFLSLMRGFAMKMDLNYEKQAALEERLITASAQLVDMDNYIYQLPGCQAFGPETALSMVDAGAFVPVYQRIEEYLLNKNYIHRKGPYRVGICLGMAAPSTLYGKLMPYMHSIDLHEHYYIQGPTGCEAEARQLFCRMVQAHVAELVDAAYFPVVGVIMGHEKIYWSWEKVINKRHGFWLESEMICARKEPIYMKAFIQMDGWRYLMVRKYFLLHFITDDSMEKTRFFENNPAMFYETFFFSKERAAFHYQNDGVPKGGNPCSGPNSRTVGYYLDDRILQARDEADWFLVHRFAFLKASIYKENIGPAASEAWRLNNSMAGQAAYVASLCESLQDIILLAMEYGHFPGVGSQHEDEDDAATPAQSPGENPNPLDMSLVHKMTAAFVQKARHVAQWRVAMLAWAMGDYVEGKLKSIMEKDRRTREIFLIIDQETISSLEELKQLFLAVAAMIGGDIFSVSPHAQATVKAAEQKVVQRPTSVSSQVLVDPDVYRRSRPKANRKILDDDMLYAH